MQLFGTTVKFHGKAQTVSCWSVRTGVCIIALIVASWWHPVLATPGMTIRLLDGALMIDHNKSRASDVLTTWNFYHQYELASYTRLGDSIILSVDRWPWVVVEYTFSWDSSTTRSRVSIPLVAFLAAAAIAYGCALFSAVRRGKRRTKRLAAGQCEECGYDLRGSPERCPECGTPIGTDTTTKDVEAGEDMAS